MKFYREADWFDTGGWLVREFEQAGVRLEVLDGAGVVAREPALEPVVDRITGGIYFPDDESGDAHQFCQALAALAAAEGVEFRYGIEVRRLACRNGDVEWLETSDGRMDSDAFVLAAGSYSPLLARDAGLDLPVRPVKGYSLTFDASGWDCRPAVPIIDDDIHLAFTPLGARLRIAGTAEFAGYDPQPREARLRHMRRLAAETFPRHADAIRSMPGEGWAGLRPYCCDGVPIIGPTPCHNLFLNTGHGHLGWSMAVGSGRLLADLMSEARPEIDPSPYALSRFR
jgi:D-amino-acid dehydrogenase